MKDIKCPNCGLNLAGRYTSHSCDGSSVDTHAVDCGCVYCDFEQQFAAWPEVPVKKEEEEKLLRRLNGLMAIWSDVSAEYIAADFDRQEELVDVRVYLRRELSKFLHHREERKFLQAIRQENPAVTAEFSQVCKDLGMLPEMDRTMRLG